MFAKALIFALVAAVSCSPALNSYGNYGGYYGAGVGTYGVPVYRSSALYGGLASANGYGYGANYGRVAGLGALRTTGAIVGSGGLGYGTGAYVSGVPAVSHVGGYGLGLGSYGVGQGLGSYGVGQGLGSYGVGQGLGSYGVGVGHGVGSYGLANLNVARGVSVHQAGPVNAAVQTVSRTVDYRPVPYSGEPATVQDIDVPPQESPLRINFQSKSSPLAVTQQHIPAEPGQVQVTHSEDEPQTAVHNVVRPVVQQVNEVIQPFRTLTQAVEPVIEQTHTNIAQGEGVHLTGLTSGVVGGSGVIAASGVGHVGHVAPAVAVAAPHVGVGAYGHGIRQYGVGLRTAGLYGHGLRGGAQGLYGTRTLAAPAVYGAGIGHGVGYGGYRSIGNYGNYGTYGGYGLGGGLALNGLSGLSTYGQTAKVIRY